MTIQNTFHSLEPNTILSVVEKATDIKLTPLCRSYTSYINRVYELQTTDERPLIVKFYRPGRWSKEALRDEHHFLLELSKNEIPIIAPLPFGGGETLAECDGTYFALFEKKGGRNVNEFNEEEWLEIGRLIGRIHQAGSQETAKHRLKWHPENVTKDQVDFLISENFVPKELQSEYTSITNDVINKGSKLFEDVHFLRIHGDLHFANLIYRPGECFYVIDFDDMMMGPAVQDFWMIMPGYQEETVREMNLFLEGYETFRPFDRRELKLIEVLRAMRYIYFCSWCAWQVKDGGFHKLHPDWGSPAFWRNEIKDLHDQLLRIIPSQT